MKRRRYTISLALLDLRDDVRPIFYKSCERTSSRSKTERYFAAVSWFNPSSRSHDDVTSNAILGVGMPLQHNMKLCSQAMKFGTIISKGFQYFADGRRVDQSSFSSTTSSISQDEDCCFLLFLASAYCFWWRC